MTRHLDERSAPWLFTAPVQSVFSLLCAGGGDARIVGGAVRDALLARPVADVDFATTLEPQAVLARCRDAGYRGVPTGLAHGTVTLAVEERRFEVTTLRRDVVTDGRRADVAFTTEWDVDAHRRDFTINALYADNGGRILDPVGGVADLDDGVVRFIGDAQARIREDYLRILRFFRMHAWYGRGAPEPGGLHAIEGLRAGLSTLSRERVGSEILRLMSADNPLSASAAMADTGVSQEVFGCMGRQRPLADLVGLERQMRIAPDPLRRLSVLWPGEADRLARGLRLPGALRNRLVAMDNATLPETLESARRDIVETGPETFRDRLVVGWARSGRPANDIALASFLEDAYTWSPPDFPVSGDDALSLGIPAGPAVGVALRAARDAWIESDYALDRVALLTFLASRAGKRP